MKELTLWVINRVLLKFLDLLWLLWLLQNFPFELSFLLLKSEFFRPAPVLVVPSIIFIQRVRVIPSLVIPNRDEIR